MAMATPLKPVRTCTILSQALMLPKKNLSLVFSVFLISLLTSSLESSGIQLSTYPLLTDLTNKNAVISAADRASPTYYSLLTAIRKDMRDLAAVEIIFLIVGSIVTVIVNAITIYAFAVTHVGKLLTLKDLLCNVKGMLKGSVITQLLLGLLSYGYVFLSAVLVGVFFYAAKGSTFLSSMVALLAVVAAVGYLYLMSLWRLSTAVSVLEQGCYGVGAIARATKLIEGSKLQGTAITIIAAVAAIPIAVVHYLASSSLAHGSIWSQVAEGLVRNLAVQVVRVFMLAAFTVFYYECKRSHGGETSGIISDAVYMGLPTTTDDDVV